MKKKKKQQERKQREKRLGKERNLRRNRPGSERETPRDVEVDEHSDPTSLPMDSDRLLRAMLRAATSAGVQGDALLQARFGLPDGRDIGELAREALALGGVEAAQELAHQALEAPSQPRAIALASKALDLDPKCCDALALLAAAQHSEPRALVEALEHAVRCGAEQLGEERLRGAERGQFGLIVEARPYLRARAQLCRTLLLNDRSGEALEHARDLVALDLGDLAGARRVLLRLLLEADQFDEAHALIEFYDEDDSPTFAWGAVLATFLRAGAREASVALRRAREVAPDFEHALLEAEFPEDTQLAEAFVDLGKAWITHGPAFEWLAAGAPLSTPAEREVLCASFTPPVAELLELGQPSLGGEWPDYVAAHGFASEHVPELLRMLAATELDEFPAESPRSWASLYATRVLGQLRAAAAVEPLIDFSRRHRDDDWLNLEPVFESIGPAAIDALARWLRTPVPDELDWMTPVAALIRIATAHPASRERILGELGALLLQFESRPPALNAMLCDALCELDATAYRPLVAQALELSSPEDFFYNDRARLDAWAGAASS